MHEYTHEIEKPQAGSLDMGTIQAALGAQAAEILLLRDYATRLSAAFDQQSEVLAELWSENARLKGESPVKAVRKDAG